MDVPCRYFIRWHRERDDQPHGRAFVGQIKRDFLYIDDCIDAVTVPVDLGASLWCKSKDRPFTVVGDTYRQKIHG